MWNNCFDVDGRRLRLSSNAVMGNYGLGYSNFPYRDFFLGVILFMGNRIRYFLTFQVQENYFD